jgi:decaprenylphospho-beta-D-erythro-pentofuranosid-2-ulose 2-reductase
MNDALGMPQTAVVLGGSSDIARAILRALASRRLTAALLAGRDDERLKAGCQELLALGVSRAESVKWDATGPVSAHGELVALARSLLGNVDVVVVASGVLGDQASCERDPAATSELLASNFTGPAAAMVAFAGLLRAQGQGRIVVLSSVAGVRIRRSNYAYGSSKAGIDAFAQGMSEALRPEGVGVTIVRPGWVATRMTQGRDPAPMATTPDAVAADVVRGLERGASVVWSPDALKLAFTAFRLMPQALWRRMPG